VLPKVRRSDAAITTIHDLFIYHNSNPSNPYAYPKWTGDCIIVMVFSFDIHSPLTSIDYHKT
jgi:hypothetical protein